MCPLVYFLVPVRAMRLEPAEVLLVVHSSRVLDDIKEKFKNLVKIIIKC